MKKEKSKSQAHICRMQFQVYEADWSHASYGYWIEIKEDKTVDSRAEPVSLLCSLLRVQLCKFFGICLADHGPSSLHRGCQHAILNGEWFREQEDVAHLERCKYWLSDWKLNTVKLLNSPIELTQYRCADLRHLQNDNWSMQDSLPAIKDCWRPKPRSISNQKQIFGNDYSDNRNHHKLGPTIF